MKVRFVIILTLIVVTICACVIAKHHYFREMYNDHNKLIHETSKMKDKPFLKAHMINGSVCIFDDEWQYDSISNTIIGLGKYYDFQRNDVVGNQINVNVDSVVLFETNTKLTADKSSRIQRMTILTALDVVLGLLCLSAPKACFGSCPTFYIQDDSNDLNRLADAESFSNAIAPSLAYGDIDDLGLITSGNESVKLKMLNEALETHVVKRANLSVIPKYKNEDVYITPDETFMATSRGADLKRATTENKEITVKLLTQDGDEYFSLADEKALVTKENIFLEFDNVQDINYGLKLTFRQTMMTTYALYSAIGYMGDEVGDMFAKIESSKETNDKIKTMFYDALGGIEIYTQQQDNKWKYEGEMYETGPIARNHEILPLKYNTSQSGKIKVKVVMNKGLWRLDHAALCKIERTCTPLDIKLSNLTKNGLVNDSYLSQLTGVKEDYIISMPGDQFEFTYKIPKCNPKQNFKVFLNAKGYYLEWMRESWLKDKDLLQLYKLMNNPIEWLNNETANYKKYEAEMEAQFWNSRWTQQQHKSYEEI